MTKQEVKKSLFSPENVEQQTWALKDPLGEIRQYADRLWLKDGAPEKSDWRDYWKKAEEIVLGTRPV